MTFCIPEAAQNNGLAWISVKVKPAGPIDSVAIYLYQPWDNTYKLSPYEVWAGRKFGGEEAQCTLPKNPEPTHGGRPAVAECHGVMHEYITVKQIGFSRRLFINEIAVYTPAPPSPPPLLLTPRRRGEVASIISKRFDAGQPSNDLMRAGVLVHVFDGYEDEAQPWQICHETCRHGAVDTFSSSLISRKVPWLFLSSWGATGLIMSPETQILCSFPADSGTGGHPNGRCFDGDRASVGTEGFYGGGGAYKGNSLKDALAQQYDGSYRRSHFGASGYNEIIVGSMFWEQHLPWVVEAFFFAGGNELRAQMLPAHRNFLSFYGLTAEEVPLLRYVCYVPQLDPVHVPLGEDCFVDVS